MSLIKEKVQNPRRSRRIESANRIINTENCSCKICKVPDNDLMVQCDKCNCWYHFVCVNVTAEIEDQDWMCASCQDTSTSNNTPAQSICSKKTGSTTRQNRIAIELQILEEARTLEKQREERQKQNDEEYLRKKFDLLSKGSQEDSCSGKSSKQVVVEKWVQNNPKVNGAEQRNAAKVNTTTLALQATQPTYHMETIPHSSHITKHIPQQRVPQSSAPVPPKTTNAFQSTPQIYTDGTAQPNSVQIANRHSMSRDLPNFYGSPEEWPLFISSFESSTRLCGFSNEENLLRLQRCLKGRVLEAMRGRLMMPSNVPNILHTLRIMYGRPKVIIKTLLQKVQAEPKINVEKVETVVSYSLAVQNLIATMEACELHSYLDNAELLEELVEKLPTQLMLNWATHTEYMEYFNLVDFNEWLLRLIDNICRVSPGTSFDPDVKVQHRRKVKGHVHAHAEEDDKKPTITKHQCIVCKQSCSGIENCKQFQSMSLRERWEVVKQNRLCRTCLTSHTSRCQVTGSCGINGCTYRHHRLLHKNNNEAAATPLAAQKKEVNLHLIREQPVIEGRPFNCNAHGSAQDIKYRVVPVILHSNEMQIETFAFLDDGSSLTMMEDSLADELKLKGKRQPLYLKWTGNAHRNENDSRVVSVEISGTSNPDKKFSIPIVRTVKSLSLPQQSLNAKQLAARFPYLHGYPIQSYEKAVPRMLIGLDNLKLAIPLKVVEGGEGDPVATKTRLGWIAYGPSSAQINCNGESTSGFNSFHECECVKENDDILQNMMKEYFSLDSLGVSHSNQSIMSKEEERAYEILETQTVRHGSRFETALLWKYDNVKLPNSFQMALRRHDCLMKKLSRNPELAENLKHQFQDYLAKSYIRKLSTEELQQHFPRTWYLPIFAVTNQNKPGKTRIVWDAAAEVHGVSLNSVLLKGPDQLIPLLSVLYRFRERPIALCADIREMFHQVGVRSEDQHAQRFLWSDDLTSTPDVYVMQVLTFGATCSPSCAQFVKNKNTQEFLKEYPRAVNSILQSHYVDDLLDSVDTEEEAITLANEVKLIHKRGGFEIKNWISNSTKVIEALGEKRPDNKRSLDISPESTAEKVLGMWWCTKSDTFTYAISPKAIMSGLLSGKEKPTKRQVLRVLMTIFDPLGLIANALIYIKILMQEIWRSKIEWDEQIPDNLNEKWCLWVNHLKNISQVRIPRCYLTNIRFGDHDSCQLHVFVDASINAFAAVAYIRVTRGQNVECRIITAKTRVAPHSLTSIPRLELEAARLGARLANNVRKLHTVEFTEVFYWSDSKTVLSWIQSDHRNYKQYVGFRVSEILETTDTHQWRYVPTKENVADDATKWQKVPNFDGCARWFVGPSFLMQVESEWPVNLKQLQATAEELRPSVLFHHAVHNSALAEPDRHSTWRKLVRTQAFASRFIWNASTKRTKAVKRTEDHITHVEYVEAENCLYRQAQLDSYGDEITVLKNNLDLPLKHRKPLDKSSPIRKFSPYIDQYGVLRLRGRIDVAIGANDDSKRPILLPKGHHITSLVIKSYHEKYHHHNNETVLNEVRQKFSIPNLRVAIKKERKNCQLCKNQAAMPRPPEMGDLPSARLSTFSRPFTFIGIDYFGPMYVTIGRHTEKRWGVLITCMTTRSIHLEISNSLTSDSCILAIKRFIARRGVPKEIRCDNGTNFHGAEKELKQVLKQQQPDLANEFSSPYTKWIYNPPASPHMGGSWERLIQSVKKTLYRILPTRNPSEELLHSMLLEVERVVNSRPLTYVTLEHDNDEVLTPNHFLLGSSSGEKPDSIFTDENSLLRRNWMKSQQYANAFWKRWLREYLPTLTRRTKWFEPVKPISVGDIVIVVDEANPRNLWPKGRVVEVKLGKDGQVRRATVQTTSGIYERPAVKLAVLDVSKDKATL